MLVFLALFIVVTGIHLFACFAEKEKLRQITKLVLMPSLLLCYISSTLIISPLICLAIFASFLGDAFLLKPKEDEYFLSGLMCFALAHVFYMSFILPKVVTSSSLIYIIIGIAVFCGGSVLLFYKMKNDLPKIKIPILIYSVLLSLFCSLAFVSLLDTPSTQSIMLFAGTLLFLASDGILSISLFQKDIKYDNFIIMITYIAAQFLIVAGLLINS